MTQYIFGSQVDNRQPQWVSRKKNVKGGEQLSKDDRGEANSII